MSNATIAQVKIHAKVLVRNKDGRPSFDDPEKVKLFMDQLTEEDLLYLEEKFDDNFRT